MCVCWVGAGGGITEKKVAHHEDQGGKKMGSTVADSDNNDYCVSVVILTAI